MRLYRACDCYSVHCEHNPPKGYRTSYVKGEVVFVKDEISKEEEKKMLFHARYSTGVMKVAEAWKKFKPQIPLCYTLAMLKAIRKKNNDR